MLKRTNIRVLSLLLVLSMILSVMPSATAVTTEQETPAVSEAQREPAQVTEPLVLDEKSVPEIVGLETARDRGHVLRLREEEQGQLNKLIFLNEDGSRTMYLYDHPVKYVDEKGTVRDISLEIVDTGDAAQPFRTASGAAVTTFSANLSDGITLSGNSNTLRLVPVTGGRVRTASRLDAETIQYPYGTHTTIEYSLTYTGFKEDIVVSQYTGQTEYPFTLYTNGLTLTEIDGSWYLTDGDGKIQATIGDIIVFTADERNNTMGALRAETVVPNQEYRMTIVLDPEYLADPNTVYPIRIDPTIEVVYDAEEDNANAILDMTLFSNGTSSINSGSLTVGNHETKGTARAVMSFPGLDLDDLGIISITSATVYVRDLLCESAEQNIQCRVYTGPAWSSGTCTSDPYVGQSLGLYVDDVTFGYEIGYDLSPRHFYSFDITTVVQGWYSGEYDQDKGIVFRTELLEGSSTYQCRTLASFNRSNYKPYLEVNYHKLGSSITSSTGKNYVTEGETLTLTANGMEGTITWSSSNTSVATIHQNGLVFAIRAGETTITAHCPGYAVLSFTLWVTVPNGVYYIKNMNSNLYLHVRNGGISNLTDVCQLAKYLDTVSDDIRIRQLWKICYLDNGFYSIRPMNKLDKGLDVTNGNVDIFNINVQDNVAMIPSYEKWTITWIDTGYVFKNNGSDYLTMQVANASTESSATVVALPYANNINCKWDLDSVSSPPSGAYWYVPNSSSVAGTSAGTKCLNEGTSTTASELGLVAVMYAGYSNNQSFIWSSDDPTVASIDSSTGAITANLPGTANITATSQDGGYMITLTLQVNSLEPFHSSNIQYMRFVVITGTNENGMMADSNHTVSVVKSTLLDDDYCIIHNNVSGEHEEFYVTDELISTLNNLESAYQDHYNPIPLFNTVTDAERFAHDGKVSADLLVSNGYVLHGSSEYYGIWAHNYAAFENLAGVWNGIIDTAMASYGVYLTLTSFYTSYMMTSNTPTMEVTSTQYQNATSIFDDIDDELARANHSIHSVMSADERNQMLNLEKAPYKPGTPVVRFETTQATQYVRVYREDFNRPQGSWIMRYSDIQGLTPAQIKDIFALQYEPTHYCFVNLPAGTQMYTGIANEIETWGHGGALQFEIIDTWIAEWFSNGIPFP